MLLNPLFIKIKQETKMSVHNDAIVPSGVLNRAYPPAEYGQPLAHLQ